MAFSFGSTTGAAAKPTGFAFGSTATSAAPSQGFGAGFGSTAPSAGAAPAFGGSFGATGGATAAPAFGAASSGTPVFGANTSAAPAFGFASTATSAAPSFGAGFGAASTAFKTTSAAPSFGTTTNAGFGGTTGFGFGGGTLGGATTTTSSLAFGGQPPNKPFCATTTASIGLAGAPAAGTKPFSFGAGNPSITAATGLGGAKLPQNAFGAPQQQPVVNLGLGGTTNSSSGGSNESNKNDIKALKETHIPNEILSTVDEFKKLVKEERNISSDIAHISSRIHDKIKSETEALVRLVSILSSGIKKNKAALDKLKLEAAQELRNAEIAQRTKDTPGALQYENVAPYEYFSRLVSNFENDMLKYRQQIDETEQHLHASASSAALSPEDLSKAIRKIHEAFTSLAGRYQHIHDCIQEQKTLYVKLHRQIYGVSTDLFDSSKPKLVKRIMTMEGPSPFILGHRDPFSAVRANLTAQPQQSSINNANSAPSGPPTMGLGSTSSFGIGNSLTPQIGQTNNTTFSVFPPSSQTTQQQGVLGSTMSPFSTRFC
ncbi:nucleoporin p58/p45 [Lepeophtheirus salmonis]|uniref:nucleoporin p58/p45 n=1 Tax=Lepeophtheirus salmonis TaxID=72036 RepID=UPI001AEA2553|nr:nucleoporin p58/p45-like [Lepeophtheirus salmonis]